MLGMVTIAFYSVLGINLFNSQQVRGLVLLILYYIMM